MGSFKSLLLSIGFSVLVAYQPLLAADPDPLIGQPAPGISGKIAVGRGLLRLESLMSEIDYEKDAQGNRKEVDGKYVIKVKRNVVILNFFSKTCIPCVREIPTFNRLAEEFKSLPVKMVYVNVDSDVDPQEIGQFIIRRRIQIPMMLPNQRETIRKYNAVSLPRLVVIDRKGIIAEIIVGFHEDLADKLTRLVEKLVAQP